VRGKKAGERRGLNGGKGKDSEKDGQMKARGREGNRGEAMKRGRGEREKGRGRWRREIRGRKR